MLLLHSILFIYLSMVLGFELRASHLPGKQSGLPLEPVCQPFLCWVILRYCLKNYLPGLALSLNPPDLCFPGARITGIVAKCSEVFSLYV
jgi:hypothetical protein